MINNDIQEIIFTEEQIQNHVKMLGEMISNEFKDEELILVGILNGSAIFLADLARRITNTSYMDFISVSSYGNSAVSSGVLTFKKDISFDIKDKNVIIVEDIIDSGNTLSEIRRLFLEREPKSLKICTIFDKPTGRVKEISADYPGLIVPDEFVVGYGLDYAQKYRNLPYLGILKREIYS